MKPVFPKGFVLAPQKVPSAPVLEAPYHEHEVFKESTKVYQTDSKLDNQYSEEAHANR